MSYYKEIQNIKFADGGYILLPQDESKKYPVLYLFHGIKGVNEWTDPCKGNIAATMEMIAGSKETPQCIVVMPKIKGCENVCNEADIEEAMTVGSYEQFYNYDICGLVKYINSTYGQYVKEGKNNTAIAGFSMGATAAIYYAVWNRGIFGNVGAVSVALNIWYWLNPKDFVLDNEEGAIHYIGYGTAEGSKFVSADKYCIDSFKTNMVDITEDTNVGTGHDFSTFNPLLKIFFCKFLKADTVSFQHKGNKA